jgi:hypothetical protein
MHSISPTALEGAWTQMTLLVVPRSIPATEARPRNPIFAMTPQTRIARPINEGRKASIPPEGESEPCFCSDFDFFVGFRTCGALPVTVSLSRFLRRALPVTMFVLSAVSSDVVRHMYTMVAQPQANDGLDCCFPVTVQNYCTQSHGCNVALRGDLCTCGHTHSPTHAGMLPAVETAGRPTGFV